MKTTIDKEFFEKWKDEDVAMWCKKKEYAEEFCRLMDENNLTWNTGESYLKDNYWDDCTIETAYSFNIGGYCRKEWCRSGGYTILDFEDYIVKEKMTKQELVELMIENFTNEGGVLDLSHLDFTKYKCNVDISGMKVSKTLFQNNQKADNIFQDEQEVKGSLFQNFQKVQGELYQSNQEVQGDLFQNRQEVGENLYQDNQEVQGNLIQDKADETKQVDNLNERTNNSNNLPAHYNIAGIDTMDLILTICEHNNTNQRETFYLANTLKYLIRHNNKNGIEDLNKAKDYLNRLIEQKTLEDLPFYDVDGQGD